MKRSTIKVLLTIFVALGGVAFLAFQSAGDVEYYVHVEQLMANPEPWLAKNTIQVHGFAHRVPLKPTLDEKRQTVSLRFELESKGKTIEVYHEGTKPDTFNELSETVVKGKLSKQPDGTYLLTTVGGETGIMAKCPSKYAGKS